MNHENHDEIESDPLDSITELVPVSPALPIPESGLRELFAEAHRSWLMKSPSRDTRRNYACDVGQFIQFVGSPPDHLEKLSRRAASLGALPPDTPRKRCAHPGAEGNGGDTNRAAPILIVFTR